jgi:stearoyl-CoA desaturase (delta-9 desaturase)
MAALFASCFPISLFLIESYKDFLLSYAIASFITTFGIAFGIHRITIHKAANIPKFIQRFSCLVSVASFTSSPILWAGSHYVHHQKTDDLNEDPHTPKLGLKVLFGYYNAKSLETNKRIVLAGIKSVAKDKFQVFIHNWYNLILFSWYAFLACFGFETFFFVGILPSAISFYSLMCLNFFTHNENSIFSYKNNKLDNQSLNVPLVWFLTFGENWHNNHHFSPGAETTKEKWWEIDIIYFYIWLFSIDKWQKRKLKLKMWSSYFKRNKNDFIYK